MKANYLQSGETLDYRNTGEKTIYAGDIIVFKTCIGVAGMDIPPKELGTVHVTGVYEIPKKTAETFSMGTPVYYSADGITAAAEGNTPVGYAVCDVPAEAQAARVKLRG